MIESNKYESSEDALINGDIIDPRIQAMENMSVVNKLPEEKIDARYLQIVNKYPFIDVSPILNISHIFLTAGVTKDFFFPDGTKLVRFNAVNDSYVAFYNTCPAPSTSVDRLGNGGLLVAAKILSPLYYLGNIRVANFYCSANTTIIIEHGM